MQTIREIAPSEHGVGHRGLESAMTDLNIGRLTIETVFAPTTLGSTDLGGTRGARLVVMEDGMSRGSGCDVYTPLFRIGGNDIELSGQQGSDTVRVIELRTPEGVF